MMGGVTFLFCLPHPECTDNADIAFVLDQTVRQEDFDTAKTLVKTLVDQLNVGEDESNVALVTFSNDAQMWFRLDDHHDRSSIKGKTATTKQSATTRFYTMTFNVPREFLIWNRLFLFYWWC